MNVLDRAKIESGCIMQQGRVSSVSQSICRASFICLCASFCVSVYMSVSTIEIVCVCVCVCVCVFANACPNTCQGNVFQLEPASSDKNRQSLERVRKVVSGINVLPIS